MADMPDRTIVVPGAQPPATPLAGAVPEAPHPGYTGPVGAGQQMVPAGPSPAEQARASQQAAMKQALDAERALAQRIAQTPPAVNFNANGYAGPVGAGKQLAVVDDAARVVAAEADAAIVARNAAFAPPAAPVLNAADDAAKALAARQLTANANVAAVRGFRGLRGIGASGAVLGGAIAIKQLSEGDYKGAAESTGQAVGFWGGAEATGMLAAKAPIPHPLVKGGVVLVAGLIGGALTSWGGGELLSSMVDNPQRDYRFIYNEQTNTLTANRTGRGWGDKEGTAETLEVLELKEGGAKVVLPGGVYADLRADEKGKLYLQLPNANDPTQPGPIVEILEIKDLENERAEARRAEQQRLDSYKINLNTISTLTPEQQTALAWVAQNLHDPSGYKSTDHADVTRLADRFSSYAEEMKGYGARGAVMSLMPHLEVLHKNNITIDAAVEAFKAAQGKTYASFDQFRTDFANAQIAAAEAEAARQAAASAPGTTTSTPAPAPTGGSTLSALADVFKPLVAGIPVLGPLAAQFMPSSTSASTAPATTPAAGTTTPTPVEAVDPAAAPAPGETTPAPAAPAAPLKTYTIAKGDSLSNIIANEYEGVPNNGFGYIMLREAIKIANPELGDVASGDQFKLKLAAGTTINLPTEEQVLNALSTNKISFEKAEAEICAALNCPAAGLKQAAEKQGISFGS